MPVNKYGKSFEGKSEDMYFGTSRNSCGESDLMKVI